jgi:tellurite resistance protein TerC
MPAPSAIPVWTWAVFVVAFLGFIALDLGVFHRESRVVTISEAAGWMCGWGGLAAAFGFGLALWRGRDEGVEFAAGYLIEFSLSLDNIFVIALLFGYFNVPLREQHRVLFWGILGALAMRGLLIGVGAALVNRFDWMFYILGVFLVGTGARMFFARADKVDPEKNFVLRFARRVFPIAPAGDGRAFITKIGASRALTPLALVLILVETSDLVFALDSIPAVLGVTTKPFLVFTSNVFALLGLRSLYFLLAGAIRYFQFLRFGLALALVFIGLKMILKTPAHREPAWHNYDISTAGSLEVVGSILAISVLASLVASRRGAK